MAERIRLPDAWAAIEHFFQQDWSDGLPVVPPTEPLVQDMLAAVNRDAREVVGLVPPRCGEASIESLAVHAVLAGCRPAYFPVIVAAVEALLEPRFGLHGVIATTHVSTPLLIVNGPIARDLNINAGPNLFGQGWRANATIGRAIRLILGNLGGGLPGGIDQSTLGHPGKYTYCIAENEAESPWLPVHVERGFRPEQNAVTVFAALAPHQIGNQLSNTAAGVLTTLADGMRISGSVTGQPQYVVVIAGEHMRVIGDDGWTKAEIKRFLFEHTHNSVAHLKGTYRMPGAVLPADETTMRPLVQAPEDIIVIAAGSKAGVFSAFIPGWGGKNASQSVTKEIRRP